MADVDEEFPGEDGDVGNEDLPNAEPEYEGSDDTGGHAGAHEEAQGDNDDDVDDKKPHKVGVQTEGGVTGEGPPFDVGFE